LGVSGSSQIGYVNFVYGLCFVLMAMQSLVAYSRDKSLPWRLLAAFGILQGTSNWLETFELHSPHLLALHVLRLLIMVSSFAALLEFGRLSLSRDKALVVWLTPVMLSVTVITTLLLGPALLDSICRYTLCLPGALLAACGLWRAAGTNERELRSGLRMAAAGMLIYACAAGVVVPKGNLWPADWLNYSTWLTFAGSPIQSLQMACSVACLIGVWWHCVAGSRETEERYRALYQMSRDAIVTLEPPFWRFTAGNPAALQLYGFAAENEFVSLTPSDLSPERQPDERLSSEKAVEMIETALEKGSHLFDWTHRRANGEEFPATVLLTRTETAERVFLQATVRDITARRQAERALRESEQSLSTTLCSIGDAVFSTDAAGLVVRMNPAAECLTGYALSEAIGVSLDEILHLSDLETGQPVFLPVAKTVETGEIQHLAHRTVLTAKDNTRTIVADSCSPTLDFDDTITGTVVILRDVTVESRQMDELRDSRERYQLAATGTSVGIWDWDLRTNAIFISSRWKQMLGYDDSELPNEFQTFQDHLHPEDRSRTLERLLGFVAGDSTEYHNEFRLRHKDGSYLWVLSRGEAIRDESGRAYRVAGSNADITQRKLAEEKLLSVNRELEAAVEHANAMTASAEAACTELDIERAKLQSIIDAAQVGILLTDNAGSVTRVNRAAADMVGKGMKDMVGMRLGDSLGCAQATTAPGGCGTGERCPKCPLRQTILRVLQSGKPATGIEVSQDVVLYDGENRLHLSVNASRIEIDDAQHVIVVITDISELKAQAEELIYKSNHDSLTGLPNRQYFEQQLSERTRLSGKIKMRRPFGLMFIDLDKFKLINDTLGHKVGDLLLEEVAARLQTCIREQDVLARMGGDEFTVIVARYRRHEDVEAIASRIIDVVSRTFTIQGHRFVIGASIGLVSYPEDGYDAQTLLRHADAAMYKAKQAGRGTSRWYTGDVDQSNQSRVETEMDIRTALEEGQFKVYYQPIVGMDDGQIHAAEALIRWEHPKKGMISPSLFIPIAEEIGLIGPIGEYVLRTACFQAAKWHKEGMTLPHMSVNLSTKQLRDPEWIHTVETALRDSGLKPHGLYLELTESELAADYELLTGSLRQIEDLGVGLAIDDFGMGHSSLSRLKDFRVIHLKIDGSFVRNIECSESDKALLRSIIDMAHGQGICVTAEWVETKAQMEILRTSGCDFGQGYHISPPVPADEFAAFAAKTEKLSDRKRAA
jgi:diguanylate cyclase (GGDEF)-like protein/PAS domain S-box-containing protein